MKTLILTDGNEGIDYYMVNRCLENRNCTALLDLNCDNLNTLKKTYPETLLSFKCDVCNKKSVKSAINHIFDHFGTIQYAVHNACLCLFKNFIEHSREDYDRVMNVNFYGTINLTDGVIPFMKAQKQGKIFFTSSGVGVTGFINISSYSSSKGAIESPSKCLNIEYAGNGISFHILHPPLTNIKSDSPLPFPVELKYRLKKQGMVL